MKFNKQLLKRARRTGRFSLQNKVDDDKHMYVAENALIELMKLCEPLSDVQTDILIEKTKNTPFFSHLRVELLNKQEEFVQCLMLFIESDRDYKKSKVAAQRVFDFINNKLDDF